MCINKLEAMKKSQKLNLAQLLLILFHDTSYISFTLFTRIKFERKNYAAVEIHS